MLQGPMLGNNVCMLAGPGAYTATWAELQSRAQPISLFLPANADMMSLHVVNVVGDCGLCWSDDTSSSNKYLYAVANVT